MSEERQSFVPYAEHKVSHNGAIKRIEDVERRVAVLEETVRGLMVEYATIRERLDMLISNLQEIKQRFDGLWTEIKEIRYRPTRLWDGFVLAFLSAGIGGIIAVVLQTIFKK